MNDILLSVIIVNYNTGDLLANCLKSIQDEIKNFNSCQIIEIIIVDNNSQDKSLKILADNFSDLTNIRLIKNLDNKGFAKANNQAVNISRGKYIYFLNPDTLILKNSLKNMLEFMEKHRNIGLAGTKIICLDKTLQSSVEMKYPGERYAKKNLKNLPGKICWVLGASMIARSFIIKTLNGFDERYFLYGEDIDLCVAIRRLGFEIGYINNSVIVHLEGQSEKNSFSSYENILEKKFKAELIFYNKNYSKISVQIIKFMNILQAIWRIFNLKFSEKLSDKFLKKNNYENHKKLVKYKKALEIFKNF